MNYLEDITVQTPLGEFHMIAGRQGGDEDEDVVRASGFGDVATLRQRLPAAARTLELRSAAHDHPYAMRVRDYFAGDITALDTILREQDGSAFYQKAWRAMQATPPGKTLSYTALAAQTDNPTAVRAAGTACGKNVLILLVPCHRIIRSDGQLGNYMYGSKIKADLLALEAKHQDPNKQEAL